MYSPLKIFFSKLNGSIVSRRDNRRKGRCSFAAHSEQLEVRLLLSATYGDFNGDGYDDMAVGVAGEDIGSIQDAGAVNVIYGTANELNAYAGPGDQIFHQDSYGINDKAEARDRFGSALASGDFNNDGFTDLAIGVPGEDIGTIQNAGAVNVIYGSARGLQYYSGPGNQFWHQDSYSIEDKAEQDDRFGSALAVGDFNGDGVDDLAIGVWGEDIGSIENAGAVNIIYGRAYYGLTPYGYGDQIWHQNSYGINDTAEANDRFGWSLAAGDFDGNGSDDLAIGTPGEDIGSIVDAGAVNVIYGKAGIGLQRYDSQIWHQNTSGIADAAEVSDGFGTALAVGDFNRNGAADLAIGVPGENIGSLIDAGAVNVIYGTRGKGLTDYGDQFWNQNSYRVEDLAESYDGFGSSLAAADFDNNGSDDLAIGVPLEDLGSIVDAGAVNVVYGSSRFGLYVYGNQIWHQNVSGISEVAERGDRFGESLAAGNFDRNSKADLAIGVGGEDVNRVVDAGAVNVIYGGSTGGLNAYGDQIWSQNSYGIADVSEKIDAFGGTGVPQRFTYFWVNDASGDDTSMNVFAEGAMRFSYNFDNVVEVLDGVWLEALSGDKVVASWGRFFRRSEWNKLIDLTGMGLVSGTYQFRMKALMRDGQAIFSQLQTVKVLSDTTVLGSFRGETFDYSSMFGTGTIIVGAGGTDTLDLGISSTVVSSFNGGSLSAFDPLAGAVTSLAIYHGTTFDFLRLTNGREIYFQGIEKLVFSDGVTVDLQIQTNDPSFSDQWNLHVSDVGSAWRFTQGSEKVLLVSLDTGLLTPEGGEGDVYDMTDARLITDATDDDNLFGSTAYGHGHKAISVMSAAADNGFGIAGINWNSDVMVADVYGGVSLQRAIQDAIIYARQHEFKIVFQGGIQGEGWLNSGGTQEQLEALIYDNRDIALFAMAAGNGNVDIDDTNPDSGTLRSGGVARLQTDHRNVMAVGALKRLEVTVDGLENAYNVYRASYSNYGAGLTLMAATDSPAVDKFGSVVTFTGTSAANPNMAAIASLVWSVNPDLDGGDVRQILIDTAMDLEDVGHDDCTGEGLVNADAAVRRALALTRNYELARLATRQTLDAFYTGTAQTAHHPICDTTTTGSSGTPSPSKTDPNEQTSDSVDQIQSIAIADAETSQQSDDSSARSADGDLTIRAFYVETGRASMAGAQSLVSFSTNDADVLKNAAAGIKTGDSMVQLIAKQESSKVHADEAIASTSDVSSANAKTADGHGVKAEAAIDSLFANFNESLVDELLAV